ncbi:MAG TPA: hypothetical protein H9859_09605 [Candidatus Barnesiella excrementigallinarum]|nr:hypothetical protein [Candidatus Barnesiella excrementigallinarum]
MRFAVPILPRSLRFRRWNRHSYSTFCSIGKCVNIGNVRKEIADKSLKKGRTFIAVDNNSSWQYSEERESRFREIGEEIGALVSMVSPLLFTTNQNQSAPLAGEEPINLPVHNISGTTRYNGCCFGLFIFPPLLSKLNLHAYGQL